MDKQIINLSKNVDEIEQRLYNQIELKITKGDSLITLKINCEDLEKIFDQYRVEIGEPKIGEIEDEILSLQSKIEALGYEIECLRNPEEMRD